MIFPYEQSVVDEAGAHFDKVVGCILNKEFKLGKLPDKNVCKECDLRTYCTRQGDLQ